MRVFLDVNVLFSVAWNRNSILRRLWKLPSLKLLSSEYAVLEVYRNLDDAARRHDLADLLGKKIGAMTVLRPSEFLAKFDIS